jgi:hypothetical protein
VNIALASSFDGNISSVVPCYIEWHKLTIHSLFKHVVRNVNCLVHHSVLWILLSLISCG